MLKTSNVFSSFIVFLEIDISSSLFCLFDFDSLRPIKKLSAKQGRVFLG